MIDRLVEEKIRKRLFKGKTIVLLGARQVGKSTLLQHLITNESDTLWLNADEEDVRTFFDSPNAELLKRKFGQAKIVVVDEAQRIQNIGIKLKLVTDQIKNIQLIVTGSSSFELVNSVNEPLTGRKWEYMLYPISYQEMRNHHSVITEQRLLNHRLIYGSYPEVITEIGEEKELLQQLSDSLLYKDILNWQGIKKPEKLVILLKSLAFQLGNQVSYNELSQHVGLDKETIEKYINLLEKSFIIFRLPPFNRNLRNELKRSRKIYFYDNGIRNALLANYTDINLRTDKGALWENYLVSERIKLLAYQSTTSNKYFWRNHAQAEIDWVEDRGGQLHAYEFKWNTKKKVKPPLAFTKAYPSATFKTITPENYDEFLTEI